MLSHQGLSSSPSFAYPGRGDLIAGRYRVERKLGQGGMGLVVQALDEQMGTRVAVKLLLPEAPAPSPAFQQHDESGVIERSNRHVELSTRLVREASAAARLSSDHVTRVLDVGRMEHGDPYVVMELLEGVDLGKYAKARGPLPMVEAVTLVLQACEAISEAHGLGIVHRDLKPANLFLTRRVDGSPFVKVLDFGISKVLGADDNQLTGTSDMLGSPLYMAPEQIRNARDVDARVDVWSLGTILYRLLAGRAAFEAEGSAATLAAIISDAPPSLRAARPDVPAELEHVLLRCLEKERSRRIQTVRELAALLVPFAQSSTGTFPRVPSGAFAQAASFPSSGSPSTGSGAGSGSVSYPSGAGPAMPSHPAFTPAGGMPAMMTSVAPNSITVSGGRSRTGAVAAALVGIVVTVTGGGFAAWKLLAPGAPAAAGSGEGSPAGAVPSGNPRPASEPPAASLTGTGSGAPSGERPREPTPRPPRSRARPPRAPLLRAPPPPHRRSRRSAARSRRKRMIPSATGFDRPRASPAPR